ncbi:MAG TPA: LTA synthase family protein [Clostridiales bacterium]|nr:LTA synthase family protein [Clostridiales bacterium]
MENDNKTSFWKGIRDRLYTAWNRDVNVNMNNFFGSMFYLIVSIMYLEIIFHVLIYHNVNIKIIYPVLFAVPFGMVVNFIIGLFPPKVNKALLWCIMAAITLVFCVQLVYYSIFKVFFSFQSVGLAGDAFTNFEKEIFVALKANLGGIILLLLPFLLGLLVNQQIDFSQRGIKEQLALVATAIISHAVAVVALMAFGRGDYSPYDLYYQSKVPDLCGKQLGVVTMTRLDMEKLLFDQEDLVLAVEPGKAPDKKPPSTQTTGGKRKAAAKTPITTTEAPTPTPVVEEPNVMSIDFEALAKNESNKTIKKLHQYFASVTPTNKNRYTGMFKGYNLILITAEGFSPYAIDKEKTPTLYKMVREGFVFKNFYTALWQTSTSDGEYVALTGLIPTGTRSMYKGRNNLWPFALGRQFDALGVASKAYHNHTYTYYQRDKTHPNLGYIYKGLGNGLKLKTKSWPESDLEMMQSTVDDYIGEGQFHAYYMTVSGHMNYTFTGNSMSSKNRSLVKDLPYSEDAKAYIACQVELDRALEYLIKRLEEAGVADRTVIALSADHYPYGWEKDRLDELAGHEIDPNFEIYKNHFILWNPGMTRNIVVDKPCSSMDILPTLSNLFGLTYDSRLLMGQDILSDSDPLVYLSNRSFITDKVMYNSENGKAIYLTDEPVSEDYIDNINNMIKNKFTVSQSILENDYYRYVFPE